MQNTRIYVGEVGYVELLREVLIKGVSIPDRTGVGCKSLFGATIIYDKLPDGSTDFAFSTIRSCPLRMAFEEFMFFIRGETNTKLLENKGVHFWKPQTTREFLDKRGMQWAEEGSLEAAYSSQWRRCGQYSTANGIPVVDQLQRLLDTLKYDKYSRRMVVDLWNPVEEYAMPITPCWAWSQYLVLPGADGKDYLHLSLVNRSLDVLFGAPFALQQYRLFQLMLCKMFGFEMGEMRVSLSHIHLYNNQVEYAEELFGREFGVAGQVDISKPLSDINSLLSTEWSDIIVTGLEVNKTPFKSVRPPMAA